MSTAPLQMTDMCSCPKGYNGDPYVMSNEISVHGRKYNITGQGSISCSCLLCFTGDPVRPCEEITSCQSSAVFSDDQYKECTDINESFTCSFPIGFTSDPDVECFYINECATEEKLWDKYSLWQHTRTTYMLLTTFGSVSYSS